MLFAWLGMDDSTSAGRDLVLLLAKVTVTCVAAGTIAGFAQKRSADLAHKIWITALTCVLFLPMLSQISPHWIVEAHWPIASQSAIPAAQLLLPETSDANASDHSVTQLSSETPLSPADNLSATESATQPTRHLDKPALANDESNRLMSADDNLSKYTDYSAHPKSFDWMRTLWAIWLLGIVVEFLRLGIAVSMLARIVQRATPSSPSFRQQTQHLAQSLEITRAFEVRLLPRGAMPMACWLGQWIVLVPEDLLEWPEELHQTVVAHELGHLKRRDAWSDFLTQIVCAIYWPHPLMWWAGRAIPRLRERACDEWVLASGFVKPGAYARHLIDVIERCHTPSDLAPAMARKSDLESRLRHILASRFSTVWSRPIMKIVAVACCLGLAGIVAGASVTFNTGNESGQEIKGNESGQEIKPITSAKLVAEPIPADGPAISAHGVVVSSEGKPLSGVEVLLRAKLGGRSNRDVLARTATNKSGEFTFDRIAMPRRLEEQIDSLLREQGGAEILARADNRALTWMDVRGLSNPAGMRLVLYPEAKVTGLVVDKTGKGVFGAQIRVWGLTKATTDIDTFFRQPGDLNLLLSDISLGTKTDVDGRFTLPNLPMNSRILMAVEGPGSFRKVLAVDTGEPKVADEIHMIGGGGGTLPLQSSPLKIERNQQKFLTFAVVDHTGQSVKHGSIYLHGTGARGLRETWLDQHGEARLEFEHAGTFTVSYGADPLHPRIGASRQIEVDAEMNAPTTELRLPESKWLSGCVVDAESGKGIVGVTVHYSHRKELQENDYSSSSNCETDADGKFKLPVLPGKARIEVRGPLFGYFVQSHVSPEFAGFRERVTIDVPGSGTPAPVKLELARGLVVRGIVRDKEGKPVVGARIDGLNMEQPYRSTATVTNAEGRYELTGFNPRVGVLIKTSSKSGAANFSVRGIPNAPLDQTLNREVDLLMGPGVTLWGRVKENGKPRPGIVMRLHHSIGSEKNRYWAEDYVTNSDGVYRASGLEVGDSYRFEVIDSNGKADRERAELGMRSRIVPAGSVEVQLDDVHLASNGQSLRGVVVDPHGNPVPEVTVSASIGRGTGLTLPASGSPPWTETDKDGRFEIRQLPEEQIELMAYRRNPFGAHLLYPAKIKPKLNDQNIRIIYDPNLNDDVEDLDKPKTQTLKPKNR